MGARRWSDRLSGRDGRGRRARAAQTARPVVLTRLGHDIRASVRAPPVARVPRYGRLRGRGHDVPLGLGSAGVAHVTGGGVWAFALYVVMSVSSSLFRFRILGFDTQLFDQVQNKKPVIPKTKRT